MNQHLLNMPCPETVRRKQRIMILQAYTLFHVLISLVAIGAGCVVAAGMLKAHRLDRWTKFFLTTTVLTSVTGFFFPFHGITPALIFGVISLAVLAVAIYARYSRQMAGGWSKTYVITALFALYLNVFVLVVQSFLKIPALREIAPQQNEPPFAVTQLVVLALFVALGILASIRFRQAPAPSALISHPLATR